MRKPPSRLVTWYDDPVKQTIAVLLVVLTSSVASAQSASSRAWQQRLEVEIPLPVPMVELQSINPFAVAVDEAPVLNEWTPPRKVDISGTATVAAFVDAKGECLGSVPLGLPFPGLTGSLVSSMTSSRFDPAMSGSAPQPSWAVLDIVLKGRVKQAEIVEQNFEFPDPETPPTPRQPIEMSPPGSLQNLKATPHAQLSSLATPRRVKVSAGGRDDVVQIRALVHVTETGRCDRYVPLELDEGLNRWVSAFLATWKLTPATREGQPVDSWVVYTARIRMELSGLDSQSARVVADREYVPQ